jgi:transposase-like protein
MARHRSFGSEFKRQIAKEFIDGQAGLHELARRHSLSRNLIRLWKPLRPRRGSSKMASPRRLQLQTHEATVRVGAGRCNRSIRLLL